MIWKHTAEDCFGLLNLSRICSFGLATTGYEAVSLVREYSPDVVLLDIEMENATAGITGAMTIHEIDPSCKIIMLTVHDSDSIVFQAFEKNITNYMLKTVSPAEIVKEIRDAYQSIPVLQSDISEKLKQEFRRIRASETKLTQLIQVLPKLTSSEREVLKLLLKGYSQRQVSEIRIVEYETVKKQIGSILRKFHVKHTQEIIEMFKNTEYLDI